MLFMNQSSGAPSLKWPILKPDNPGRDAPAVRLNRLSCVIGDRSRVHLPLPSPLVSRAHALIIVDSDEVYVRDLASRNKLFVNGSPVREVALRSADLLEIGPYRFRCWAGFNGSATGHDETSIVGRLAFVGSGRSHPIDSRTFLIGRRAECDLPLSLQTVSRVHAVVFRRGGRHFVRDLNSKAGTIVNGEPIREVELNEGDELQIAAFTIRYHTEQELVERPLDAAAANHSDGSVSSSQGWRTASGLLSGSGGVGEHTSLSDQHPHEQSGTQDALLGADAPPATPDELGIGVEPNLSSSVTGIGPPNGEFVDSAELFPTEISLPARDASHGGSGAPPHHGNGNGQN